MTPIHERRTLGYDLLAGLPTACRETVRFALKAAFGPSEPATIAPVGGGASGALPFKVEIRNRQYLVRVEGSPSPLRNPYQYESMRIAADAGISPKVHFIDEARRVAIMDFVEERPLESFPGGPHALAREVGTLLRRLQEANPFPYFVEYPEIVGRLWRWVCQTGLFAPGVLDPITERLEMICDSYVWDSAQAVACHNDPVPRNILFDGERLWLIDWESAYRNDPLVDVAIVLDNFARSPALESVLVRAWLGRDLDVSGSDRLTKVRALTRLYYAGVFLSASAAAQGPSADRDLSAPGSDVFLRALRDGQIMPGSLEAKHTLGKIYLSSFMTGDVPPGLSAAV
jgi:aminoglycoside phosphotransferase (APT) family kinase protein